MTGGRTVEVTRTYLELTARNGSGPAAPGRLRLERLSRCPPALYRRLYEQVGGAYHWVDRLGWTDDGIRAHLAQAPVSIWLLRGSRSIAGYFELQRHDDGSTEIAYIGLMPAFVGRGVGRLLIQHAIDQAWATGAARVWLHTCTLDHPAALPTYLKLGFRPFRSERYRTELRAGAAP